MSELKKKFHGCIAASWVGSSMGAAVEGWSREKIKETYGTAYYTNTYRKLRDLKTRGILNLNKLGKSSIVELNFENYLLIDFLSEIEIRKKIELLERRTDIHMLLKEMDTCFGDFHSIKSICSIDSQRNLKLNKME